MERQGREERNNKVMGEGSRGNGGNGGGKRGGKERQGKGNGSGPDQVLKEIDAPTFILY